ncbi:MAG: hypothetical protein EOP85_11580 [Verrucomicrobiaceae bacterium]|nr:MAG: hypothetical protein EOP85_11580 [Verrucomicrobiaceae bacterium]
MMEGLREQWRTFKSGRPGHRFHDRYERNKEALSGKSWIARFIKPVAGIVLLVAGVVFCLIPGPGAPLLLIGACLMADVSLPVARALDWFDIQLRNMSNHARKWWGRSSAMAKSAVILLVFFLASGAGYGGFRLLSERW